MPEEKLYIATQFDGWYWHYHVIKDSELKEWMRDDSFDDDHEPKHRKWHFYEISRELTKQELKDISDAKP